MNTYLVLTSHVQKLSKSSKRYFFQNRKKKKATKSFVILIKTLRPQKNFRRDIIVKKSNISMMKLTFDLLTIGSLLLGGGTVVVQAFDPIGSYVPTSYVHDHHLIELDLDAIDHALFVGGKTGFRDAERIYREGAFTSSYAELSINTQMEGKDFQLGMEIVGFTHADPTKQVRGSLIQLRSSEDGEYATQLVVEYDTNKNNEGGGEMDASTTPKCAVGGNPQPIVAGCFQESGTITIPDLNDLTLNYSYNVYRNNMNRKSLSLLGHKWNHWHEWNDNITYPFQQKYRTFFETYSYSDAIVTSAFHKEKRFMDYRNFNFGFGLNEVISKSILHFKILEHVVLEMETATRMCYTDRDQATSFWDRAVAFYYGQDGSMLWHAAQSACEHMNTETNCPSMIIIENFEYGQRKLRRGDCHGAESIKDTIINKMTVTLIQNTIYTSYILSENTYPSEERNLQEVIAAKGSVYGLSVVPLLYNCSADDSNLLYRQTRPPKKHSINTEFSIVKAALERNYQCLGISCADIGGVWNKNKQDYYSDVAMPCDDSSFSSKSKPTTTVDIASDTNKMKKESKDHPSTGLLVILILVGIIIVGLQLWLVVRNNKNQVEFDTGNMTEVTLHGRGSKGGNVPDVRRPEELPEKSDFESQSSTVMEETPVEDIDINATTGRMSINSKPPSETSFSIEDGYST